MERNQLNELSRLLNVCEDCILKLNRSIDDLNATLNTDK